MKAAETLSKGPAGKCLHYQKTAVTEIPGFAFPSLYIFSLLACATEPPPQGNTANFLVPAERNNHHQQTKQI